jgi:hypothetical protein
MREKASFVLEWLTPTAVGKLRAERKPHDFLGVANTLNSADCRSSALCTTLAPVA